MKKIPTSKTKWKESKVSLPTLTQTFKPVLTKQDFVRRYQAGEFGNHSPSWDTINEFLRSGYSGLVHLRNRVAGGPTWYDVPSHLVDETYRRVLSEGHDQIYFSGMAPTHLTVFQGEVRQSERYLDLYYSTIPKPMRASLLEGGKQVYGLEALGILKALMPPSDLEWVFTLLDRYQNHIVEFSTYSTRWGTLNEYTTIWEVRDY